MAFGMSAGAAALVGGIAGPVIGGLMSSNAAGDAANTQAQSTQAGIDESRRQYDLSRSDQAPYRQAGTNALSRLQYLLGVGGSGGGSDPASLRTRINQIVPGYTGNPGGEDDPNFVKHWADSAKVILGDPSLQKQWGYGDDTLQQMRDVLPEAQNPTAVDPSASYGALNKKFSIADFWNDPVVAASYQSGLDLGTKALKNAAPLTTGLDSGAAMKELTKFGTDYTGNMAAGSQARYVGDQTNTFNRLAGLAGVGQQAVNNTTAAGTNTANNITGLISSQGNANAAAKIAGANSWGNGVNSVSNWWNQQQMLNRFAPQGGGGMNTNFNGGYSGNPTYNYDSYGTTG